MKPASEVSIRRFHERRDSDSATPEQLFREAGRLLAACGVAQSGAWILRTVRDYSSSRAASSGFPFGAYLMTRVQLNAEQRRTILANSDLAYVLEYADPTGETAVRNVIREGSSHGR